MRRNKEQGYEKKSDVSLISSIKIFNEIVFEARFITLVLFLFPSALTRDRRHQ